MADIKEAPTGSIIVLHGCAHNPTGNHRPSKTKEIAIFLADSIDETVNVIGKDLYVLLSLKPVVWVACSKKNAYNRGHRQPEDALRN
eukprot:scaffold665175_cov61-Prasinocladus_malaysianus.AAC.1